MKNQYNIRVINLSLGQPLMESYTLDPLCQAVEQAWKAGIVVVTAAGNFGRANPTTTYGYGTITSPCNDPYVITVRAMNDRGTATRTDDVIATYSSKGPTLFDTIVKPDLVAPGNLISSTLSPSEPVHPTVSAHCLIPYAVYRGGGLNASTTYLQLSGTSMASPVVSAAGALADPAESIHDSGSGESTAHENRLQGISRDLALISILRRGLLTRRNTTSLPSARVIWTSMLL